MSYQNDHRPHRLPPRRSLVKRRSKPRRPRLLCEALESRILLSAPATLNPSGMGGGGWFGPTTINPYNNNEIWMPTDMGELFHSTNSGATWTYNNTISVFYRSPVQFTGSSNVMWDIDSASGFPSKSTDGGNTWSDATSWSYSLGQAYFLYTDPTLSSNFIVCSTNDNRIYLSTDGGNTWGNPIYTGTSLSGTSQELVVSGLFKEGNNVWIGTSLGILYSSNDGGSFNMLTTPWNPSSEAPSSMAVSESGNTVRFVVTTVTPSALYDNNVFEWSSSAQNVYTSDFSISANTQGTWTNITSRLPADKLEGFAAMAQGNISTIYLGGEDTNDYGVPSVLKSTDGGLTWNETFQYVNNANVATDQYGYWGSDYPYAWSGYAMSLQVCSNNVNLVTISDMGTAWMTADGGTGGANTTAMNADWKDITVAPQYLHAPGTIAAAGATPYAGSADNTACYNVIFTSPTDLFAAMTDQTGLYSTDGGASWYYPTFNSGADFSNFFAVTQDNRTGVLFAAAGRQNDLYKDWRLGNGNRDERGGGLDYSTDGGKTWSLLAQWSNPDGTFNPLTDFVIDPNVPGRAYALVANSTDGGICVTNNLYLADGKTVNPNCTWTQLTVPSRTLGAFTYGWGSQAYAAGTYYAHDPSDLAVLGDGTLVAVFDEQYDSTDSYMNPCSGVWVSSDGGQTWTDRSDLNLAQSNMMFYSQKICIDPNDPTQNTWYLATDFNWPDYRMDNYGVFMTTDRGATWTSIFTTDVNDEGVGCDNVTINPDTGEMYISTSSDGVYYSATRSNFTHLTQEPYSDVDNVVIDPYRTSQVWICTHGNGIREGDAASVSPSNVTAGGDQGHQVTLNWASVSGASSYLVQYSNGVVNGTGEVTWITSATLPAGSTSANIDGLPTNSSYYFRIVPENGSTILGYSNITDGPVLASATTVAASSDSPHEIDVTWQYSGIALDAQFQVQRSTDDVNWTAIATTSSASITSYADTTVAANTLYYYRIVTVSGSSFESSPSTFASARTTAAVGLIAYDGFFYQAAAPLSGQGVAGDNWAGPWTVAGDSPNNTTDIAGGLTPPGNLAISSGGSMSLGETGGIAQRDLSSSLSSYGSTLWASALVKTDVSDIYNSGYFAVGNVSVSYYDSNLNGAFQWAVSGVDGSWYGSSWGQGPSVANDTTYFVVMEITYNSGKDNVRVWLDPAPGTTAPTNASAFDYNPGVNAGGNLNNVDFGGSYYANTGFDELRLGATYASVAPLPLPTTTTTVTASNPSPTPGQSETFTATVTPASGSGETGTVQFLIDGSVVGGPVPVSGNTATYTTSSLSVGSYSVLAVYSGDSNFTSSTSSTFTQNVIQPAVANAYIFYFGSTKFDGGDTTANPAVDFAAVATDKSALLPGQTAIFANYTSYVDGINGILVDFAGLASGTVLTASDFQFAVGNNSTPSDWATAPAPLPVVMGTDPSNGDVAADLVWANNAIQDQWLQVTVLADSNTGLASNYVFYFGNAIGSTGDNSGSAAVGAADVLLARNAFSGLGSAAITNDYDFNRDGRVTAQDVLISRNGFSGLSPLKLITVPAAAPAMQPAITPALAFSANYTSTATTKVAITPAATTPAPTTPTPAPTPTTPMALSLAASVNDSQTALPTAVLFGHRSRAAAANPPQLKANPALAAKAAKPATFAVPTGTHIKPPAPFLLPLPGPIADFGEFSRVAFVPAESPPWLQTLNIVFGPALEFRVLA